MQSIEELFSIACETPSTLDEYAELTSSRCRLMRSEGHPEYPFQSKTLATRGSRQWKASSMAIPLGPHSNRTAREATGSKWTGSCARRRATTSTLEIAPVAEEPEPKVPADLRKARAVWSEITPIARRDRSGMYSKSLSCPVAEETSSEARQKPPESRRGHAEIVLQVIDSP